MGAAHGLLNAGIKDLSQQHLTHLEITSPILLALAGLVVYQLFSAWAQARGADWLMSQKRWVFEELNAAFPSAQPARSVGEHTRSSSSAAVVSVAGDLGNLGQVLSDCLAANQQTANQVLSQAFKDLQAVIEETATVKHPLRFFEDFRETSQHFTERLDQLTGRFQKQLNGTLNQLQELSETLRGYVQDGSVANSALFVKGVNDFRTALKTLTASSEKMDHAIKGFNKTGSGLLQLPDTINELKRGVKDARAGLIKSEDVTKAFAKLAEQMMKNQQDLSTAIYASNSASEEVAPAIEKLREELNNFGDTVGGIYSALAGIQQNMSGMPRAPGRF